MKLASVEIENYRAIKRLVFKPDPALTVLFGANGVGKTSLLSAIATGLGAIQTFFHPKKGISFLKTDRRDDAGPIRIELTTTDGVSWRRAETGRQFAKISENRTKAWYDLRTWLADIRSTDGKGEPVDMPIVAYYDTDRVVFDTPQRRRGFGEEFDRFGAMDGALSARTDQLSGGYRAVLTLAADLARRLARGNPHIEEPLKSEAVVLIDEIELHLHPSWQQRILGDLRRTFPNAQFIVSTHSPQVLTTVVPEHIRELAYEDGRIVARPPASSTFGAEAGEVLSVVMGVDERPENRFTTNLDRYRRFVASGKGESPEALVLREKLQGVSPDDPALRRADLEIRQRKMFSRMAEPE